MSGPDEDVNARTFARIDPVIGAEVSGYKIVARIGNGGMGIVYEGEHAMIGKRVAIKVLRHEVAENPDIIQRLVAEARAVNTVGHRGIIDVFGFGTLPDGRQCIVMEYLEGEPLEDVLQKHVRTNQLLPVADVLLILDEICSALAAAHSAGVVHRDLKPSNVFLCAQRDGTKYVKLLDFGIAKLGAESGIQSSVVIGTPTYMAPEQAAKGLVTPALDLYSLGVMAFELLTGRPPFLADSPVGLLFMHAKERPPKLTTLVGDLPVELEELIERLLAKRPDERPENAAVVRLELGRIRRMLPSRGSGVLTVEVQPSPRPSQANLPAVRLATIPSTDTQHVAPPRASPVTPAHPAATSASSPSPRSSQPRLPAVSAPAQRPSQPRLPAVSPPAVAPVSAPSPRPSQPNLAPVSSPSPRPSQPRLPAVSPPPAASPSQAIPLAETPKLETGPNTGAAAPLEAGATAQRPGKGRLLVFGGVAVLALVGVGLLLNGQRSERSSGSGTTGLPPAIVAQDTDAGAVPTVAIAPPAPDASTELATDEDAGAAVIADVPALDAGAPVVTIQRDPILPRTKTTKRDPAEQLGARITSLERKLTALAKDPDQNVGIYQSQLKALKARVTTATSRAEFDTLDLALRRLEADVGEL